MQGERVILGTYLRVYVYNKSIYAVQNCSYCQFHPQKTLLQNNHRSNQDLCLLLTKEVCDLNRGYNQFKKGVENLFTSNCNVVLFCPRNHIIRHISNEIPLFMLNSLPLHSKLTWLTMWNAKVSFNSGDEKDKNLV